MLGVSVSSFLFFEISAIRRERGTWIPWLAVQVLFWIMASRVIHMPSPLVQFKRLVATGESVLYDRGTRVQELLKKYSQPGENVVIHYPFGHLLASRAGIQNLSPFSVDLITLSEIQRVTNLIQEKKIRHVFGILPAEELTAVVALGFDEKERAGDFLVLERR